MSNEIIIVRRAIVGNYADYKGVCHKCNSPVECEKFLAVIIWEDEQRARLLPLDIMQCPHCGDTIKEIMVYKSLEVSKELTPV